MLTQILHHKLANITGQDDRQWAARLRAMLEAPEADPGSWLAQGAALYSSFVARIAREEGTPPFSGNEFPFKDHLPHFVSSILADLEQMLYAPLEANVDLFELRLTAVHLLLKVAEWLCWNYEGRCVYGREIEEDLSLLESRTRLSLDVWGEKDEVWLYAMEILREDCGLGDKVLFLDPLFSCRRYGAKIPASRDAGLGTPLYWEGGRVPEAIEFILVMATVLTDQTRVSVALSGKDQGGGECKGSGRFEAVLLSKIAASCGTPVDDLPGQ